MGFPHVFLMGTKTKSLYFRIIIKLSCTNEYEVHTHTHTRVFCNSELTVCWH